MSLDTKQNSGKSKARPKQRLWIKVWSDEIDVSDASTLKRLCDARLLNARSQPIGGAQ